MEVGVEGVVDLLYQGEGGGVLRLTEGEQGHVDCHVRGAYPPPTFRWEGPTPTPWGEGRVRKNVEEEEEMSRRGLGNLTILNQVR